MGERVGALLADASSIATMPEGVGERRPYIEASRCRQPLSLYQQSGHPDPYISAFSSALLGSTRVTGDGHLLFPLLTRSYRAWAKKLPIGPFTDHENQLFVRHRWAPGGLRMCFSRDGGTRSGPNR